MILALLTQQEKNLDKAQGLLSWDLSVLCSVRVSVEEGCAALHTVTTPGWEKESWTERVLVLPFPSQAARLTPRTGPAASLCGPCSHSPVLVFQVHAS